MKTTCNEKHCVCLFSGTRRGAPSLASGHAERRLPPDEEEEGDPVSDAAVVRMFRSTARALPTPSVRRRRVQSRVLEEVRRP